MRFLAFTDTHGRGVAHLRAAIREHAPDFLVCVGDFTVFGQDIERRLREIDALGLEVVLIHGNHEDEEDVARLCAKSDRLRFCHGTMVEVKGIRFLGWGGGGFREHEPGLDFLAKELDDRIDRRTVILSHAPPAGTRLDQIERGWHVGVHTLREIVLRKRPMLLLCGHIHECFHVHDRLGSTVLINPGPEGEIIEVPDD